MTLKINYPEDKTDFENMVACLRALLILETINNLEVSSDVKKIVKKEVIKKLCSTWNHICITNKIV